jgi:Nucleotidyltransferase domain.
MRPSPIEAAAQYAAAAHPGCLLAVLGGSAARRAHGPDSDLDIVVVERGESDLFRKVVRFRGWVVDCFILTETNYRDWFDAGLKEANPSLQRMIAEGTVLRSAGRGPEIAEEARADLAFGPLPWSPDEIDDARNRLSETAADLLRSACPDERRFIAGRLALLAAEFLLRTNRRWIGEGKHLYRCLRDFSPEYAAKLGSALEALCARDDSAPLLDACRAILEPFGGELIVGYER